MATKLGWRSESKELTLDYNDNRPIVIGETLSVQETANRSIKVGSFGLHAYNSLQVLLENDIRTYVSLNELFGKVEEEKADSNSCHYNNGRIAAESRHCIGVIEWKRVSQQLRARQILPVARKLIKKYPELKLFEKILLSRAAGEDVNNADIDSLQNYLNTRLSRDSRDPRCDRSDHRCGHRFPPMMLSKGPMVMWGDCFDDFEIKPPKEYSAIMDMLTRRLDKAKEKVLTELLGAKTFAKAKKYAMKVNILEGALKKISDLNLNEVPKFVARKINALLNDDGFKTSARFAFYVENYDTFDFVTKESLEEGREIGKVLEDQVKEYEKKFFFSFEEELKKVMALSLKEKKVIDRIV